MEKLTAVQIESWIFRHFPDYKKKSGGRQLVICNPFDGDSGFHFWIGLERVKLKKYKDSKPNYWVHDFRPGHKNWDSSFLKFVQNFKKSSFYEAVREVCGNANAAKDILLEMRMSKNEEEDDLEPEETLIKLPDNSKPISDSNKTMARKIAINYLKTRCVSEELATTNLIHYTATSLVFPYLEYGMMVYWQRRDIMDKAFEFPTQVAGGPGKGDFVYGFDHIEPGDFIIVVEAIFDKLSLGNNAIATGGADMTPKQVRKVKALNPSAIVLAPDNDEAGLKSLRSNYFILKGLGKKMAYCFPPIASHEKNSKEGREFTDWNKYDQTLGMGWSRKYIENNTFRLSTSSVINPRIGEQDVI